MGEATVPAEQPAAGQAARIPAPDVDAGGSRHHQGTPRQGSRPAVGLIWRVRDRSSFAALGQADRVRRGSLSVAWLDDGRPPPPRVAFAISKKVGSAVTRNRVRRRLRELARRSQLAPGVWFVSASTGVGDAPFATLSSWWFDAVAALQGRA
jgi:ribonuclease P protein component